MHAWNTVSSLITHRTVQACVLLDEQGGYLRVKDLARDLLDNPRSRRKRYFDLLMVLLVLGSVGLLVYGVENPLLPWVQWFEVAVGNAGLERRYELMLTGLVDGDHNEHFVFGKGVALRVLKPGVILLVIGSSKAIGELKSDLVCCRDSR